MKKQDKVYVVPGVLLPVGLQDSNLVIRTLMGCKVCATLKGEPILAYEVKNTLHLQNFKDSVAEAVKPERFDFEKCSDDATFEQFNAHNILYNQAYRQWEKRNLTLEAVKSKLNDARFDFDTVNFYEGYN
jgi:hypothetical protein